MAERRGMHLVLEALRLEDFPIDRQGINYAIGDIDVEDGHGGFMPVRDLTDQISLDRFDSPDEVIAALRAAMVARHRRVA